MFVFTCPTVGELIANGRTTSGLSADQRLVPHCPSGGGEWVHVSDLPSTLALSTSLGLTDVAALLGAAGLALAVAFGFRMLFEFIRNR